MELRERERESRFSPRESFLEIIAIDSMASNVLPIAGAKWHLNLKFLRLLPVKTANQFKREFSLDHCRNPLLSYGSNFRPSIFSSELSKLSSRSRILQCKSRFRHSDVEYNSDVEFWNTIKQISLALREFFGETVLRILVALRPTVD